MHLIRIIPKHPGTLLSAAFGPTIIALLGIGSTWMMFTQQPEESGSFESIIKVATMIAYAAIAATFTWIHVRKQRRYHEKISSLPDVSPTDYSTGALASTLEPHLNWLVSTPEWEAVGKAIDRRVEWNQQGPLILCVGAVQIPDAIEPLVTPMVIRLWGPRIGYWMVVLAIGMMAGVIPLSILMSWKRDLPVNTLQILFWGVGGLIVIGGGSQIRRLSGALRQTRLELFPCIVEFVVAKSRNTEETRRSYPLTSGTTIVVRVNPLYLGDPATITLIRGGMSDTVSLSTKSRTNRLFGQILALCRVPQ